MATLTRHEIVEALERLGQLTQAQGDKFEFVLVGGALMVLAYGTRQSTRDVDAVILAPRDTQLVRTLVQAVATERGWPDDWLNDGAKGYLVGLSSGPVIFSAPGIEVLSPSVAQLLAMKLSAQRDNVDIADARRLLQELGKREGQAATWEYFLFQEANSKHSTPFLTCGRVCMVTLEQLARTALSRG